MLIGECLSQVATHTVLTILKGVDGEERDVLQINSILAVKINAQLSLCDGTRRLHHQLILFPFVASNLQLRFSELLILLHRSTVDELHFNPGSTLRRLRPYGETVVLALMQADAEETVIRES